MAKQPQYSNDMANPIFNLFGYSPVRPLQQHMAKVQECISEIIPFFDAVVKADWQAAAAVQARIAELENEADALKKNLRLNLPTGLFMAMSRRDLLEVLTVQDRIANKTKDIAGLILGREMDIPPVLIDGLQEFARRCVDASGQAKKVVNELDELVETGFRGAELKLVDNMITELDRIEGDTDRIQVEVRAKLYAIERELNPVDVMFLYRVIEWVGDLGDLAQRVGSRLQLMLAK